MNEHWQRAREIEAAILKAIADEELMKQIVKEHDTHAKERDR